MEELVEQVRESCSAAVLDGHRHRLCAARAHPQDHAHQPGRGLAPARAVDIHGPGAAGRPARRRTGGAAAGHLTPSARTQHTVTVAVATLLERMAPGGAHRAGASSIRNWKRADFIAAPLTNRAGADRGRPQHQRPGQPHQRRGDAGHLLPALLGSAHHFTAAEPSAQLTCGPWGRTADRQTADSAHRVFALPAQAVQFLRKPSTSTTAPSAMAPRLSHSGTLTDSCLLHGGFPAGRSQPCVVSLVKLKPPVKNPAKPRTIKIMPVIRAAFM
jgi:hypothetical protein